MRVSGKTGEGVRHELFEQIVERIPAPKGDKMHRFKHLILTLFTILSVELKLTFKVVNGKISKGEKVKFMATDNVSMKQMK